MKGKFLSREEAETWLTDFHLGKFAPKRMGQAFCQKFNVEDSVLFYMAGSTRAEKYIVSTYVQSDAGQGG
jgi:hypothetical protein